MSEAENKLKASLKSKSTLGARLLWFVGLYVLGALSVALLAYGIRYWVGAG